MVRDFTIKESRILGAFFNRNGTCNKISLMHWQSFLAEENCLFPMGAGFIRTGRQGDRLMAAVEVGIEPGHYGVEIGPVLKNFKLVF